MGSFGNFNVWRLLPGGKNNFHLDLVGQGAPALRIKCYESKIGATACRWCDECRAESNVVSFSLSLPFLPSFSGSVVAWMSIAPWRIIPPSLRDGVCFWPDRGRCPRLISATAPRLTQDPRVSFHELGISGGWRRDAAELAGEDACATLGRRFMGSS
jgi:hypothetical protein